MPTTSAQHGPATAAAAPVSIQNTGKPVRSADYRWQLAIKVTYREGWGCGGVLISPQYILTAAHCVDGASVTDWERITIIGADDLEVYFGSDRFAEGTRLALDPTWRARIHPAWKTTRQAYAWDAAILKLAAPVVGAQPAPIRTARFDAGTAVTSGWGAFDKDNKVSEVLRAVKLPVIPNADCQPMLSSKQAAAFGTFSLCAASRTDDTCVRDSGGPLVAGDASRPQTVGIVSWGGPGNCGTPGPDGYLLGIYTRTSEIAEWVRTETGDPDVVTARALVGTFAVKPRNDM